MTPVDRSSPLPVYFQLARDIRQRIEEGAWGIGERIAPEVVLAQEYGVSRVTVRQALAEL
ncbi:MAG: GntR family transcriptional regulator, partial [Gemmatimonadetes bacterium]|nr:GntR family transcriptional regulator [Gemmatimonadota bacterium]